MDPEVKSKNDALFVPLLSPTEFSVIWVNQEKQNTK